MAKTTITESVITETDRNGKQTVTRHRRIVIWSDPTNRGLTAWAVRDFADALAANGVTDTARITCDHHTDTRRVNGLRAEWDESVELPADQAEGTTP